jgi:beta-lactamase superfamily II metal-dependent hydrolase
VINGKYILIDGGTLTSFEKGGWKIVGRLKKLDLVIVTHHDSDHTKGISGLLSQCKIEKRSDFIKELW